MPIPSRDSRARDGGGGVGGGGGAWGFVNGSVGFLKGLLQEAPLKGF